MKKLFNIYLVTMMSFLFLLSIPGYSSAQVEKEKKEGHLYRLEKVIVRDHPLRDEAMVVTPDVTVINVDKFIV